MNAMTAAQLIRPDGTADIAWRPLESEDLWRAAWNAPSKDPWNAAIFGAFERPQLFALFDTIPANREGSTIRGFDGVGGGVAR